MFRDLRFAKLALAAVVLIATPAFAQNYSQRDHTVFHRSPAANGAQKHSAAPSGNPNLQHRGSSTTAMHSHPAPAMSPQPPGPEPHNGGNAPIQLTH